MQPIRMNEPVLTSEPPRGIRDKIDILQEKISTLYDMAYDIRGFIAGNRNEDEMPKVSPDCLIAEFELMAIKLDRTGAILGEVIRALE